MNQYTIRKSVLLILPVLVFIGLSACGDKEFLLPTEPTTTAVLLLLDEDAIDNGNPPNNFTDTDVNDPVATIGLRSGLPFFQNNLGRTIDLYSGEIGDEGWFALKEIPASWISTGPSGSGSRNFLQSGPGLGGEKTDGGGAEDFLDKIPDVTPLRATGLKMLIGQTILAVVYDSDISVAYSPLQGNLKGANLGLVALDVLEVREHPNASSSALPIVTVKIRDVEEVKTTLLNLFVNAPEPTSSSEPFDVSPPASVSNATLVSAP